ncbi:uncharacterized protein FFUJ_05743 [Fusarium fujikuroi IMI 58289]|uniref:Uncharacterized protein n=1 Tax=Gibberella fujikuroi (strain CBS 195.34 / IMI 58289 / NRRL A-6831) TaxID=1279085 RepID=S0E4L2_GIBF5|nr:uncharacterized protein FFUJ_05743 [Fusarium fujikuroi IMI 58289]CCT69824.1 uncharacterized protein FFUJ_05743 [Fusarium fujikuroi IMI 58289]SCN86289.1 uncharacterized protein FFM5_03881 [Fusarium fujikuroi]
MSTVNRVKYFFHKNARNLTEEKREALVRLAYQTATAKNLYPRMVFIRSDIHDTTIINGKYQKDPLGDHITMCFKDDEHIRAGTHIACHGYVDSKTSLQFRETTDTPEKSDSILKKNDEPVWPPSSKLYEYPHDGYYSHLDGQKKK